MNPSEAVKAHVDLGLPKLSVGIHWGTFKQSNEPYLSPCQLLSRLWTQTNDSQFITTSLGQTVETN